jgi:S1-C subfamily serine protease
MKKLIYFLLVWTMFPLLSAQPIPFLNTNQEENALLEVEGKGWDFVSYKVRVPANAALLRVSISDSPADLDLFLRYGNEISSFEEVDYYSETNLYNEEIELSRFGNFLLTAGIWYIDVVYQLEGLPRSRNGEVIQEIPFTILAELVKIPQITLEADRITELTLSPEEGNVLLGRFAVGADEEVLRLDIVQASSDIDLFLNFGRPAYSAEEADISVESFRSLETVIVDDPRPGPWYVTIADQAGSDFDEEFKLILGFKNIPLQNPDFESFSWPQEAVLQGLPDFLQSQALATVEVLSDIGSGSGCIISPSGYILTNYHVIELQDGSLPEYVDIAVLKDLDLPPVERYKARVVKALQERDLALLKIEADYWTGKAVEQQFPYFTIAAELPKLGEQLKVIGYPAIGSTGSRSSLTLSTGICAGYQRVPFGTLIKTDSLISGGNSGGAALNEQHQLVGLPTLVISSELESMGFIHSVTMVPQSWLDLVAQE